VSEMADECESASFRQRDPQRRSCVRETKQSRYLSQRGKQRDGLVCEEKLAEYLPRGLAPTTVYLFATDAG
jgi:hypothetical protein